MDIARVWKQIDVKEIQEKILIVDEILGFCPGCKEIGIKLEGIKHCPKCGREFRYVTSREAVRGDGAIVFVQRVMKKLPDLIFIDYHDYEYLTAKKKTQELFKDI
jgi:hypothetical protein